MIGLLKHLFMYKIVIQEVVLVLCFIMNLRNILNFKI